jgi:hypothetical protein
VQEKILDNAPAVLSCEVKEQGCLTSPGARTVGMDAVDRCNKETLFSIGGCSRATNRVFSQFSGVQGQANAILLTLPKDPRVLSFPYDMDFTPWLQFDDHASEPMEIDENQTQVIANADDPAPDTSAVTNDSNPVSTADSENTSTTCLEKISPSKGRARIDGLKTMIEDSLEHMHTKLVEDGGLDSALGKALACIIDNQPEHLEKDQKVLAFRQGGDPISRFFRLICTKFSLLSSVLTSKTVEGPGGLDLLRICCEWVLLETLCYTSIGIAAHRRWLATPAQELYSVSREGVEAFQPLPMNGAKPWKELRKVDSAPLDSWTLRRGYIVNVDTGRSNSFAKVSDIRFLGDGRYTVVYTWLYTREQVAEELEVDGTVPPCSRAHLDKMWPLGDRYEYMLSTNRTITLWDTAISRAPEGVASALCYSAVYSTTPTSRRIWSVENSRFKWMKRILLHEPQEGKVVK